MFLINFRMKKIKIFVFMLLTIILNTACDAANVIGNAEDPIVLVIHGGAGTILKKDMTLEKEKKYIAVLTASVEAGFAVLRDGESSVKAVKQAIMILEDSPLFNAGKGAVFTNDGRNELDASIMNGRNQKAGAVAGVSTIKNPISAAIAVMEESEHIMMTGKGAELFAESVGLELVDPGYFYTDMRWNALQRVLEKDSTKTELDHDQQSYKASGFKDSKFGTVGCVALDHNGYLAAGTSTGGMTNKKFGRVGDSPIIGAGTYANEEVGVSCTGWGEFYIRAVAAHDVAARMSYLKEDVRTASQNVIDKIGELGGDGGMIALDKNGRVAMPFNTAGMYRATITKSGKVDVKIYE